jgi:phosphoribosylformylglycinamidine (FGAM) synthase-like enzyme
MGEKHKRAIMAYQTPENILIKASNGASDFGNKFGQPLICGSLLTFEHSENDIQYGFDKVIMLAGVSVQERKPTAVRALLPQVILLCCLEVITTG